MRQKWGPLMDLSSVKGVALDLGNVLIFFLNWKVSNCLYLLPALFVVEDASGASWHNMNFIIENVS